MQDTALAAVAIYFGLNAAILLWMAARIIGLRRRYDVPIGDGGNAHLMRAMRGQANFVELVPMALSMLLVMALMGVPAWVIHLLGAPLTVGRVLHGRHFLAEDAPLSTRFAGTTITFVVIGLAAAGLTLHGLAGLF